MAAANRDGGHLHGTESVARLCASAACGADGSAARAKHGGHLQRVPCRKVNAIRCLAQLRTPRFAGQTPTEVYATLPDEGVYLCRVRTMYRILAAQGEVAERRRQRRHPVYQKPELLDEAANQVWSWE